MSTLQGESFYFHHGWHFLRADAFPMAKAVDAYRDAEGHAFYEAGYRETGWQPVTLPHTFNDEDLFRDRIQDGGSGQRRTAAFYRNILTIPARHKNHKVLLAFEGLRQTCYLYVNGTLAGYYEAGVAPFGFDITPYVRYDAPNLIAIATDNTATRNAPFCIAETPNKPDGAGRPRRPRGRPLFLELQRLQSLGRRHYPPRAGVFQARCLSDAAALLQFADQGPLCLRPEF